MDIGTVIIIVIASMGLLLALLVQVKDYLHRRDDRAKWYADVDSDRGSFKAFMDEIRKKLDDIQKNVHQLVGARRPLSESGSPLRLTEFGRTVSQCLADRKVVADLLPEMRMKTQEMREEYEVHDACFEYIHGDEFEPSREVDAAMRLCAYQHGVQRDGVLEVLALTLRDEILSERGPPRFGDDA